MEKNEKALELPIIDLSSPDRIATAQAIHKACLDCGFFYVINHGIDNDFFQKVFEESRKFYALPLEEKNKLAFTEGRGYSSLFGEKVDSSKGDPKESLYIGAIDNDKSHLNLWPSPDLLPSWRSIVESYHVKVRDAGRKLLSLICLALNLEEGFFEKEKPLDPFLLLLFYPGKVGLVDDEEIRGAAHTDYGIITLLANDGIGGLQVCREKFKQPQIWEDVPHIKGAFIVNIGDMMERWTNCLYRSTMHRVMRTGIDRYSIAFFINPDPDTVVECFKSCCSEASPPRFPPIRSGDYMEEKIKETQLDARYS